MNPSAFPTTQYTSGVMPSGHSEGMTLRDYFAAKAMQELLHECPNLTSSSVRIGISETSYLIADAMMKARGDK